jgi:hypothetical protein
LIDAAIEEEVFGDGEVGIEGEFLGHVSDAALDGFGIANNVKAEDRGRTGRGFEDAAEHADDGGFTGAVGAEQTEDFAALDGEGDVVNGDELAEAAGEVGELDDGVGHIARTWKMRCT